MDVTFLLRIASYNFTTLASLTGTLLDISDLIATVYWEKTNEHAKPKNSYLTYDGSSPTLTVIEIPRQRRHLPLHVRASRCPYESSPWPAPPWYNVRKTLLLRQSVRIPGTVASFPHEPNSHQSNFSHCFMIPLNFRHRANSITVRRTTVCCYQPQATLNSSDSALQGCT